MRTSLFLSPKDVELIDSKTRQTTLMKKIDKLELSRESINKQLGTYNNIIQNLTNRLDGCRFTFEAYGVEKDISIFKKGVEKLEKSLNEVSTALQETKAQLSKLKAHIQQVNEAKEKLKNVETQEQLMDISVCAN
jgi:chromosome segregation ATPase